jgi:hypothetical protein
MVIYDAVNFNVDLMGVDGIWRWFDKISWDLRGFLLEGKWQGFNRDMDGISMRILLGH